MSVNFICQFMNKLLPIFIGLILLVSYDHSSAQGKVKISKQDTQATSTDTEGYYGPSGVVRMVTQDKTGNIWFTSWQGIYKYDGKWFTNITKEQTSARFFSILQDPKGNWWFGSIGSGVFYYDGTFFRNLTTKDGLLNDDVVSIYEDKKGSIWMGVFGGVSCYDGKTFRNYIIQGDSMYVDRTGKTFLERPANEVNTVLEDKTGKLWFGTRGKGFVYDGKTFSIIANNGKPFTGISSIIEDKQGAIWLGGKDGLWRYDGVAFKRFAPNAVSYVMEDRKGNIWTSSVTAKGGMLRYYHRKTLDYLRPTITDINPMVGVVFGFLEAKDGSIWFGSEGIYQFDGKNILDFREE